MQICELEYANKIDTLPLSACQLSAVGATTTIYTAYTENVDCAYPAIPKEGGPRIGFYQ